MKLRFCAQLADLHVDQTKANLVDEPVSRQLLFVRPSRPATDRDGRIRKQAPPHAFQTRHSEGHLHPRSSAATMIMGMEDSCAKLF